MTALPRYLCSRPDAAAMLSVSLRKLDLLVADGSIEARRIGSSVRIVVASVEAYVATLPLVRPAGDAS